MVIAAARSGERAIPDAVVWHELECGSYDADLGLWIELAARTHGPVLDIGAGTGRVARVLARTGATVTALERDATLLHALGEHEDGERIERACADARSFSLPRRDFGLCLVPMHTIQLFGGRIARAAFLRCARAHLRPGGLLAAAILPGAENFDVTLGHLGPAPESVEANGLRYCSTPTRVAVGTETIVIERERTISPLGAPRHRAREPVHDVAELTRLNAVQLGAEARDAGFLVHAPRIVHATDEHVGSEVVLARA
jgi:SAM-dependent methyltransferase